MRGKFPKKLTNFIPSEVDKALHRSLGKVRELYPVWERIAGPDLGTHSRPLAVLQHSLVIEVESPVWASTIRQRNQRLVAEVQSVDGFEDIKEIRIKVSPTPIKTGPVRSKRHPARRITETAASSIARTADVVEDPSLKQALKRLLQSTSTRPGKTSTE